MTSGANPVTLVRVRQQDSLPSGPTPAPVMAGTATRRLAGGTIAGIGVAVALVGLVVTDRLSRQEAERRLERDAIEAAATVAAEIAQAADEVAALAGIVTSSRALGAVVVRRGEGIGAVVPGELGQIPELRAWPKGDRRSRRLEFEDTSLLACFAPVPGSASEGVWVVLERAPVESAARRALRAAAVPLAAAALASVLIGLAVGARVGRGVTILDAELGRLERGNGTAAASAAGPSDLRALIGRVGALAERVARERSESGSRIAALESELARRTRELEQANRLLLDLANRDALTGLANRRRLEIELDRHLALARRTGQPLAVIMMDLDRFKSYNDAAGHLAGDTLLRSVAGALRARARTTDLVVRWGGDEFCVLVPGTDPEGAVAAAAGLVEAVRDATAEIAMPPGVASVGISAGVACYPEDAEEAGILVARADGALYDAKARGRGTVVRAGEA